jgi:hypothetical protein
MISQTSTIGTREMDITCTGAACATMQAATGATFPCKLLVNFTAHFSSSL